MSRTLVQRALTLDARRLTRFVVCCAASAAFGCGGGSSTLPGLGGSGDVGGSGGVVGTAAGGAPSVGGTTASGGMPASSTGGTGAGTAAASGSSGDAMGGQATGGSAGAAAAGGTAPMGGRGGRRATGGAAGASTGGNATGGGAGTSSAGASSAGASGDGPDCSAMMPTGGTTKTGTNINGTADGLNYGIWTNGSGGSITYFSNAPAFAASWDNSSDFLAHLGLDFNGSKSYADYGTVIAQFVETKTGTSGSFSSIGIYGWMHSPCIEWYINEDSFSGLFARGGVTATIDGATYYLTTSTTNGTGGANACESGHTGSWTNITSTRMSGHQCGTVTVSDHFKAWAAQGWSLGGLASVHINVEVGGGTGSIQFPVANVTTSSK